MESLRLLEERERRSSDESGRSRASRAAAAAAPFGGTPCPILTSSSSEDNEDECRRCDYEQAVGAAGFGRFHYLHLFVCGWANAADAIEILCISFLLPTASCELGLTSADKVENAMNDQFSDIQI